MSAQLHIKDPRGFTLELSDHPDVRRAKARAYRNMFGTDCTGTILDRDTGEFFRCSFTDRFRCEIPEEYKTASLF